MTVSIVAENNAVYPGVDRKKLISQKQTELDAIV